MPYDQNLKILPPYDTMAKRPFILFGDQYLVNTGYLNNSLEGLMFDDATLGSPAGSGIIRIDTGLMTPNFYFYTPDVGSARVRDISLVVIDNKICTITTTSSHNYTKGEIVSINGIDWDSTHPNINGTWRIQEIPTANSFTFFINAPDASSFNLFAASTSVSSVFEIRDNRPSTDAKGHSYTSVLFTPLNIYNVNDGYKRILPSDLYTRFRFQVGSDVSPQGGINSNLFNVIDSSNNNIKPALWAYFFGYYTASPDPNITIFEIAFNSYAIVLRPTGNGSRLEFALLKFNWGTIPGTPPSGSSSSYWMTNIVGSSRFNRYIVSGTDLGYLISTNPEVGKVGNNSVVTEIAKSDSFTYASSSPVKLNLKISIRKHLLSDSQSDATYLVNLMLNDDYELFGEGFHYNSILHGYIPKPSITSYIVADQPSVKNAMFMPIMYFKFNNTNQNNVGIQDFTANPPIFGSSKIIQDSLLFKQINSNASYLY